MNLHAIASGVVAAVNPSHAAIYRRSAGYMTAADGTRAPAYERAIPVRAQMQSLTAGEIRQADGLNIQGRRQAIYVEGHWDGLKRDSQKGGDLITMPDNSVWLVVLVSESWPGWCRVVCTLQDDTVPIG